MAFIFSTVAGDVVVAMVTFIVLIYLYFANAFQYWNRRGVFCVQPSFPFGNFGKVFLQREHPSELLKRFYDKNRTQPVIGLFAMKDPILVVCDLDVVKNVMVKDAHYFLDRTGTVSEKADPLLSRSLFFLKGNKWRRLRLKLTPTFTSGKLKKMFYLVNECGKQLVPCVEREMTKGYCAVKETVARYTTDVIASCAFGVNANSLVDPTCDFRATTRKIFEKTSRQKFFASLFVIAPWMVKLFGGHIFDDSVNTYVRKTFWDVTDYRKKNNIVRKDFVDILMQMKDEGEVKAEDVNDLEEIKQASRYTNVGQTKTDKLDMKLEGDDIVAQAFIFIAAGFETTSSVISFTLFELALNPAVQEKLREEIKTVLEKHNSEVTYDAVTEMTYLEMVVSEALRLYPTVPALDRKCLADYKIPGTDITIEKGTTVMIPALAIHKDPAIYPEPDKFDPERFTPENKSQRSSFAHIPFGEGPRICIGMRFGQIQVKTALIHILTSFNVVPCSQTPQPPLGIKPGALVGLPRKNIVLAFEKIK